MPATRATLHSFAFTRRVPTLAAHSCAAFLFGSDPGPAEVVRMHPSGMTLRLSAVGQVVPRSPLRSVA